MNKVKLKEAEKRFLRQYPEGFSSPEMLELAKKHKADKMNKLAFESFSIEMFENYYTIVESMKMIVSRSAMVSVFEKVKFKDLIKVINDSEKETLSLGLKEFVHGNQEFGFELMTSLLRQYKLAKWPIITICPEYYSPNVEVFVKPTSAKKIIAYYELDGLHYSPQPTYDFYRAFREQINQMKLHMNTLLLSDNAAFCGFLMLSMEDTLASQ